MRIRTADLALLQGEYWFAHFHVLSKEEICHKEKRIAPARSLALDQRQAAEGVAWQRGPQRPFWIHSLCIIS